MSNHKNKQEGNFVSRRLILLQDTALSVVATVIAILLVRWLSDPIPNFTALIFHWLGISLIASILGFFAARSMKTISRYTTARNTVRLVSATLIKEAVFVLCLLLGWLSLPSPVFATMALLADFVLTMGLLLGARFMAIEFARENARVTENAGKGTVLVYGTGPESVALADRTDREGRYIVVGFFTRDRSQSGLVIGNRVVYYCATSEDLDRLQWRLGGVDGLLFPKGMTLSEMQDGSENTDIASEIPQADGMTRAGHIVKRTFDVLLSGILLIIFSPLIGLCALAVKLEDGSPVIYKQERIGFGGKPFNILKFRSMRTDAEAGGKPALYSGDDDPRLTKVGKFLRQHHLDELPQLWNVFRGDMSFIGYRPERQFYINQIMERNPRYRYLYQIRPGVTSYATLYNGYTDTGLTFLNIVAGKKF